MPGVFYLEGVIKHYDWGGHHLIPSLLGQSNEKDQAFAEYWMGTHPLGDAEVIKDDKERTALVSLTGKLPYLFKVLDVKDMLSIQVHPDKASAEKEFARENAEGIPMDSSNRNYKDDNHKPELMVALGDFWLLHGFKPADDLIYTLLNVVELRELLSVFNESGYPGLYKHIMTIPQVEVDRILQPLLTNLADIYKENEPDRFDEDFWVARAAALYSRNGKIDRGIFSIYLFNLVHLKKGEGIFQAAGVPHAYLEGQNVEIMANSDNVLRGGLTSKHIDVNELMKHVKCEPTYPVIISGEKIGEHILNYKVPVSDFRLERIRLKKNENIEAKAETAEILIATEGLVQVSPDPVELGQGKPAAIVLAGSFYSITGIDSESVVFRASGPSTAVDK